MDHLSVEKTRLVLVGPQAAAIADQLLIQNPMDDIDVRGIGGAIIVDIENDDVEGFAPKVVALPTRATQRQELVVEPESTAADDKEPRLKTLLGDSLLQHPVGQHRLFLDPDERPRIEPDQGDSSHPDKSQETSDPSRRSPPNAFSHHELSS